MPSEIAKQDSTLYALTDDLSAYFESREMIVAQLAEPLDRATDADPLKAQLAEIDGHLARLGAELATKTDNIAGVLRRMATEQDALKAEQERIHDRRKTFERAEKWLRDYVVAVMRKAGTDKLKTPANTLFLRQSDAVVVSDGSAIPPAYKNVTVKMPAWLWFHLSEMGRASGDKGIVEGVESLRVSEDISLAAIKKAIKSGVTVDGADVEFHDSLVLR
jgi:hypothetical protein